MRQAISLSNEVNTPMVWSCTEPRCRDFRTEVYSIRAGAVAPLMRVSFARPSLLRDARSQSSLSPCPSGAHPEEDVVGLYVCQSARD